MYCHHVGMGSTRLDWQKLDTCQWKLNLIRGCISTLSGLSPLCRGSATLVLIRLYVFKLQCTSLTNCRLFSNCFPPPTISIEQPISHNTSLDIVSYANLDDFFCVCRCCNFQIYLDSKRLLQVFVAVSTLVKRKNILYIFSKMKHIPKNVFNLSCCILLYRLI